MLKLALYAALVVASPSAEPAKVGEMAPAFKAGASDGKSYRLADFAGKYVVLEWTNKDCPFVRKHYAGNMQDTQKKAVEMGAVWLAVCSSAEGKQGYLDAAGHNDHLKAVKSHAKTVLLDTDGGIGKLYGAKTTPQIAIIDPQGKLIYNGAIDDKPTPNPADIPGSRNHAIEALKEAMAGKAVSVATTRPYGCSVKYKD